MKKKIMILTITSLTLAFIALVGLTYAYYRTRIIGNTNENSISVSTSIKELIYDDGTDGYLSASNIEPNNNVVIDTKTFSVSSGKSTESVNYGVFIENLVYDFKYPTFIYSLTCANQNNIPCNGKENEPFPTSNDILVQNTINPNEVHTYTISIKYLDNGLDQSDDMQKTFSGKIQIYDLDDTIDIEGVVTNYQEGDFVQINSEEKRSHINSSGEYKLVGVKQDEHKLTIRTQNNPNNPIGTISLDIKKADKASASGTSINFTSISRTATLNLSRETTSIVGELDKNLEVYNPYSEGTLAYKLMTDTRITKNQTLPSFANVATSQEGMYLAEDDYGISWYFRGYQPYNYVSFADLLWRIVRINGDGTVRLILEKTLDSSTDASGNPLGKRSFFNSKDGKHSYIGYMQGTPGATSYDAAHEYVYGKEKYKPATATTNATGTTGQSTIKLEVDKFFNIYLKDNYLNYLSDTLFCGDKEPIYGDGFSDQTNYGAAERLWISNPTPTLKCTENVTNDYSRYSVEKQTLKTKNSNNQYNITNGDLTFPIALLSADELVMAGAKVNDANTSYYLYNSDAQTWWTMSPGWNNLYTGGHAGQVPFAYTSSDSLNPRHSVDASEFGVRPVINLKSDLLADGLGTKNNPYTVSFSN